MASSLAAQHTHTQKAPGGKKKKRNPPDYVKLGVEKLLYWGKMPYLMLVGLYNFLALAESQNLLFCHYVVYPRSMCSWPSLKAKRSFTSVLFVAWKLAENLLLPDHSPARFWLLLGLTFSFFMISPTDQQVHCWAWLKKYMPEDSNLILEDVTWKYTGKGALCSQLSKEKPADRSWSRSVFICLLYIWYSKMSVRIRILEEAPGHRKLISNASPCFYKWSVNELVLQFLCVLFTAVSPTASISECKYLLNEWLIIKVFLYLLPKYYFLQNFPLVFIFSLMSKYFLR